MTEPFLGEIRMVSFDFAPTGWLQANGQTLSIQQYSALFALYGTTFGGNGTSNFQLPNLQGRTPLGALLPTYPQGQSQGAETVALTMATMPLHTHSLRGASDVATQAGGSTHYLASVKRPTGASASNLYQPASGSPPTTPLLPAGVQTIGGGGKHENMQPFLTIDFLVAIAGLWPSRP